MDTGLIVEALVKSLGIVVGALTGFAYLTLLERKFLARLQMRYGPNRAGKFGLLQPLADAIKLIFKEELIPAGADRVIFVLAPIITAIPAMIIFAVIPIGGTVVMFGRPVSLVVAPTLEGGLNIGLLYLLAITSIGVYGIALAGWSSNNKYSLLGALRSTAQMVSYELALGASVLSVVIMSGTLDLNQIVAAQRGVWFVFIQPLACAIFCLSVLAEVNRAPFDLPEAEQELTAGYHTEYSGMKFALFFMAEYIKMIAVGAMAVTLFFGGYLGPGVDRYPGLGPLYFFGKVAVGLVVMVWTRATLPRIRYDQLMALGWKVMLPLALANMALTAIVVVLLGVSS
ncbi:MAG: NADH-quinone oxidoreductase subunit NuoH [Thermoflexales bacterium]|nr:NADH-quinone oxidoreductase subunit NuoH [Thermoflexales bacterium]